MKSRAIHRRITWFALVALLAVSAMGCGHAVETARQAAEAIRQGALNITATPLPSPTATPTPTAIPTNTPMPSPTPTPMATVVMQAPTAIPTLAPPQPSQAPGPGDEVTLELTEEQLNGYLNAESFSGQGVTISDVVVSITPEEVTASLRAVQKDSGLNLGVTLHGKPQVIDGTIYLQVTSVELDDSVRGIARVLAQTVIEGVLNQYARPNGIPINIENFSVSEVQLAQDKLTVKGRMAKS